MSDFALCAAASIASGFYMSLIGYLASNTNAGIASGAALGAASGAALTISLSDAFVAQHYLALHGACLGANAWCALIAYAWFKRDRWRRDHYGLLVHTYLECVADGMLQFSVPLTACALACAGEAIS